MKSINQKSKELGSDSMTFELSELEQQRYTNFSQRHRKCWKSTVEKLDSTQLLIAPTGIGNIVVCVCESCGGQEDITDSEELF